MKSECVWSLQALLGEGPVWIGRDRCVRFVDIKRGTLHRYDPDSGERETIALPGQATFVLPDDGGGLVLGMSSALHRLADGEAPRELLPIEMDARNRTNDATTDSDGRLWFGTMDDSESEATGAMYRYAGGRIDKVGGECVITNGPAVTADGRTLYHVDTLGRTIWRFAIDEAGNLSGGELFVEIEESAGNPDGVVVDAEHCLWVALWGGWGVRRYAPDGTLIAEVPIAASQVTKIAFGGDDLRTAFVTTARIGLSEAELTDQPDAGGMFAFRAPVAGVPVSPVRLSPKGRA